jgi:2'-5' RNA ligase
LLPKEVWHINDIGQLRLETDGLPPKTEAPHITLLDSFSSSDRIVTTSEALIAAAAKIEPFEVELSNIKYFSHSAKRGWTLYAEPEVITDWKGKNPLMELQKLMYNGVTNSGAEWLEFKMTPQNFLPHVSLGKIGTEDKLKELREKVAANWQPIRFWVKEIYLLTKLVHDTTVRYCIPLGTGLHMASEFPPTPFPTDTYSININWIPSGSTDDDLKSLFQKTYSSVITAQVIVKTIEQKNFTKGWGNVVFSSKSDRDQALTRKWTLYSKPLELFPCD